MPEQMYVVRWKKNNGRWNKKILNFEETIKNIDEKFSNGFTVEFHKRGGINGKIPIPANTILAK